MQDMISAYVGDHGASPRRAAIRRPTAWRAVGSPLDQLKQPKSLGAKDGLNPGAHPEVSSRPSEVILDGARREPEDHTDVAGALACSRPRQTLKLSGGQGGGAFRLNVSARPSFRPKNVVHRDLSASRIGRSSTAPNAWDITPLGPTCRLPTNIVFANTMFAECRDLALLSRASSGLYLRGLRWRRRRIDLIATEKGQGVEVGPAGGLDATAWARAPLCRCRGSIASASP